MSKKNFLSTNELRTLFLQYFHQHAHEVVPSSSLVPGNDPTLLFTNAGMVQFKDVFLGKEERAYQRAASSQRCVRAGGKHNDLERVGYTARHHTFFEMLGNFSFGDYFKRDAIRLAWRFLTEVLHLPPEKLWVTVFEEDREAEAIWLEEMKVNPARFSRCGEESNFWSMGPTGPCGPCTEIFYDHGAEIAGGPPGSPEEDGDRYIEIWNLVFMQYDRAADGVLTPLPKPSVDTGMGLERIAAVMQNVHNNYEIDLFQQLIKAMAALAGMRDFTHTSLRVIADHIRSCAFLIADGVMPSNEGRGYVLRRIIRRALRHGNQLGMSEPFFYQLVKPLVVEMGAAFPELVKNQSHIEKTLRQEEEQFSVTLAQGLKLFEQVVGELQKETAISINTLSKNALSHGAWEKRSADKDHPSAAETIIIPGHIVFKLYDTYGFPVDLTADIARERGLVLDYEGFETAMNEQRERSRQASKFTADYHVGANIASPTDFVGYHVPTNSASPTGTILAIYQDGKSVERLEAGEKGSIILDRTPFYAESGGQVGDQGILRTDKSLFRVVDTQKEGQAHVHIGHLEKHCLKVGDVVTADINTERRAATVLNHTATHLLHMILRQVLGDHVIQKGSLVDPERLRFDFAHPSPLTADELKIIEYRLNAEVRANNEAVVCVTTPEEAAKSGAMALFGEKYGDQVRMVRFGESLELCGGTHAHHTGEIGLFKIIAESGVAAGIRRLEAVTGEKALRWLEKRETEHKQKLSQAEERARALEKQLEQLKGKLAGNISQELAASARDTDGIKVLTAKLDGVDTKSLRTTVDQLKSKLGSAVIALATVSDSKASVVVGITKDHTSKMKAGDLVNFIAQQIGGKGGGRPDLAEAGGNQPEQLDAALQSVYGWVKDSAKIFSN